MKCRSRWNMRLGVLVGIVGLLAFGSVGCGDPADNGNDDNGINANDGDGNDGNDNTANGNHPNNHSQAAVGTAALNVDGVCDSEIDLSAAGQSLTVFAMHPDRVDDHAVTFTLADEDHQINFTMQILSDLAGPDGDYAVDESEVRLEGANFRCETEQWVVTNDDGIPADEQPVVDVLQVEFTNWEEWQTVEGHSEDCHEESMICEVSSGQRSLELQFEATAVSGEEIEVTIDVDELPTTWYRDLE